MSPKPSSVNIDPNKYGVSFSIKQCRNFGIDPEETLSWLIDQGWRRFRLMSYWDEHEKAPGVYDFSSLDRQLAQIKQSGGVVTMCLGARQPRWPENHWPDWVWQLPKSDRTTALFKYLTAVISRYREVNIIISWQLENEALLKQFGEHPEVDRTRLRQEFALVKLLDDTRPCIMTTSTSWGIPMRRPLPDIVGFSFYQIVFNKGRYNRSFHRPWLARWRAAAIMLVFRRQSFIHELQLEPWGPKNIWDMPVTEQNKSMSSQQIKSNLSLARQTNLYPIDLWGGEWWCWRSKNGDESIWRAVRQNL